MPSTDEAITTDDDATAWAAWRDAVARPEVDAAVRALHAAVDAAVADRGPTCWRSGRCCRFDAYGHRLYVTGLEAAWFLRHAGDAGGGVGDAPAPSTALPVLSGGSAASRPGCPYQIDGACSVHGVRPLGCRVFFCQPGQEAWQAALYDRFHAAMKRLHDGFGLPYRYLEWRAALDRAASASA